MSIRRLKSFKTKIKVTKSQRILFAKHAGTKRHAFNWGLEKILKALENKERIPSAIDLHKILVAEIKQENPWYYEVSKCSPQEGLRNVCTAVKRWFKKISGKPNFKKKNYSDSFYLEGSFHISGNKMKLPRIGWIKCFEQLPGDQVPKSVTISKRAGEWYISYKYEAEIEPKEKIREVIGVDLGIKTLATCSDGTTFENQKAYKKNLQKLKLLQRRMSRKQKGSQNRERAKWALQKQHKKISDIRKDVLHKITTWLAKNHGVIVIECLNVSGMLRNHKLAQVIADCGFGTFRNFLSYKCDWYGSQLILADQWFPSSKLCSRCGNKKTELPLSVRVYNCEVCGLEIDRDLNAALNLAALATESSSGSNASREVGLPTSLIEELDVGVLC